MPKIQTYCNNSVYEQISDLVMLRKQEGLEDASFSNVSSMLLELGLRVYVIQRERKEGGFNQMEFNKILLENTAIVRAMTSKIMQMVSISAEVKSTGKFELKSLEEAIEQFTDKQKQIFFPEDEGE
jgi:hypothetical protein